MNRSGMGSMFNPRSGQSVSFFFCNKVPPTGYIVCRRGQGGWILESNVSIFITSRVTIRSK